MGLFFTDYESTTFVLGCSLWSQSACVPRLCMCLGAHMWRVSLHGGWWIQCSIVSTGEQGAGSVHVIWNGQLMCTVFHLVLGMWYSDCMRKNACYKPQASCVQSPLDKLFFAVENRCLSFKDGLMDLRSWRRVTQRLCRACGEVSLLHSQNLPCSPAPEAACQWALNSSAAVEMEPTGAWPQAGQTWGSTLFTSEQCLFC